MVVHLPFAADVAGDAVVVGVDQPVPVLVSIYRESGPGGGGVAIGNGPGGGRGGSASRVLAGLGVSLPALVVPKALVLSGAEAVAAREVQTDVYGVRAGGGVRKLEKRSQTADRGGVGKGRARVLPA